MAMKEPVKNTYVRYAIALMVLVIFAIYYLSEVRPFKYAQSVNKVSELQRYAAELNEAIALSQLGILKEQGKIDQAMQGINSVTKVFSKELQRHPNLVISNKLMHLEKAIKQKDVLTQKFKRINPIVLDAIDKFSDILATIIEARTTEQFVENALKENLSLEAHSTKNNKNAAPNINQQIAQDFNNDFLNKIRDLFRGTLTYINQNVDVPQQRTSLKALVQDMRNMMSANVFAKEKFPNIEIALDNAEKILELQPQLTKIDTEIFTVPIIPTLDDLNNSYSDALETHQTNAFRYRILLYVLVFSLLLLLRWAFAQLRGTVETLHIEVEQKIKAEKELEETNRQLEQRVLQRTQHLNQALSDLKDTQEELIIQEKMASVGMLTTGIAHEIKNPLNFVNNFSDLSIGLLKELQEEFQANRDKIPPASLQTLEDIINDLTVNSSKIKEHGERADNIVKTMLLHSQEASVQKELINVVTLIENNLHIAIESFKASYKNFDVTIEKNYASHIENILAAPQAISRVIIYIVDNALYAMHEKQLRSDASYKPILSINVEQKADKVVIKIRDNGIGIPKKFLDKVYEPFFTTKPTGKGNTGLGLSICYDTVVKQHKGELKVTSEEGVFTEFAVILSVNPRKTVT